MLRLTHWDRALLGVLSGLQLRDAVGVVLGRLKLSYPSAKPGGKAFASHAREHGSLPAKSDSSYLWCALPPVFSIMDQWGSSLLSHNSENTLSCIFLPPPPETKGEAGQEYDLYDLSALGSTPEQIIRDAGFNCHCSCLSCSPVQPSFGKGSSWFSSSRATFLIRPSTWTTVLVLLACKH